MDQIAGVRPGDVAALDAVGLAVGHEFHQAAGVADGAGSGFGQPDRADLGVGEHRMRHHPAGGAAVLAAKHGAVDDVGFVAGGVGEHRAAAQVAQRPHVLAAGTQRVVDWQEPERIQVAGPGVPGPEHRC